MSYGKTQCREFNIVSTKHSIEYFLHYVKKL